MERQKGTFSSMYLPLLEEFRHKHIKALFKHSPFTWLMVPFKMLRVRFLMVLMFHARVLVTLENCSTCQIKWLDSSFFFFFFFFHPVKPVIKTLRAVGLLITGLHPYCLYLSLLGRKSSRDRRTSLCFVSNQIYAPRVWTEALLNWFTGNYPNVCFLSSILWHDSRTRPGTDEIGLPFFFQHWNENLNMHSTFD